MVDFDYKKILMDRLLELKDVVEPILTPDKIAMVESHLEALESYYNEELVVHDLGGQELIRDGDLDAASNTSTSASGSPMVSVFGDRVDLNRWNHLLRNREELINTIKNKLEPEPTLDSVLGKYDWAVILSTANHGIRSKFFNDLVDYVGSHDLSVGECVYVLNVLGELHPDIDFPVEAPMEEFAINLRATYGNLYK